MSGSALLSALDSTDSSSHANSNAQTITTTSPPTTTTTFSLLDHVKASQVEEVEKLLQQAKSEAVNTADADGSTLLHWAGWVKSYPMFLLLLKFGADINGRNTRGESVLEWCIRGGDPSILSHLLQTNGLNLTSTNSFGGSAMHIAAEEGAIQTLTALYLLGVPIDSTDSRGKTPLMCSAHRNRPGSLQFLLRHGANPNLVDIEGASALHYAGIGGNESNCQDIIKQGQLHQLDRRAFQDQLTPIELAEKYHQTTCANFLRKWKLKGSGIFNRLFFRMGLDRPPRQRPILAWPQIYFFIGIAITLAHFHLYIQPVITQLEATPPIDSNAGSFTNAILTMWITAIMAIIGMGGFMYLDPGLIRAGKKQSSTGLVEAHSTSWLVQQTMNGSPVCAECRLVKPIRSKHCQLCGGCIARMDHHCPWVNSCVGVGNHRSFFGVILSMLIAASIHAWFCFWFIFLSSHNYNSSLLDQKFIFFLMCHSCLIVLGCSGLLFGQSYTVMDGLTTNEAVNRWRYAYLKQNNGVSPFSEGKIKNCLTFWGLKTGKSFIRSSKSAFSFGSNSTPFNPHGVDQESGLAPGQPPADPNRAILLEMQRTQFESGQHGHQHGHHAATGGGGQHGHSHGGQACHGHGHQDGHINQLDAVMMREATANQLLAGDSLGSPSAVSSLNFQAIFNPPHPSLTSDHSQNGLDRDPECAYLGTNDESHRLDEEHVPANENSESAGLISGLVMSSKDKHH